RVAGGGRRAGRRPGADQQSGTAVDWEREIAPPAPGAKVGSPSVWHRVSASACNRRSERFVSGLLIGSCRSGQGNLWPVPVWCWVGHGWKADNAGMIAVAAPAQLVSLVQKVVVLSGAA